MLRMTPDTPLDTLWDSLLPAELHILPPDLRRIHELLEESALLEPFRDHWRKGIVQGRANPMREGRPTIAMAVYLRLMVIKYRTGWGYETLMREVSDSLHLRRFCLIPLHQRLPAESTVRKLTRRLGHEIVAAVTRGIIAKATRERHFRARALRADSTVMEADIRFPTDAGLCGDAVRSLVNAARKVRAAIPSVTRKVRNRSRAVGRRLRALGRSLRRRNGDAKTAVRRLTEAAAQQVKHTLRDARRLLVQAGRSRSRAKHVSREGRRKAIAKLRTIIAASERIVDQVHKRFNGEKIPNRLVSLADTDARPIRRGKLAKPNEFGYVVQIAEITGHTRRGARGLLLPPKLQAGSTHENALLTETMTEITSLQLKLEEASFDAGFLPEQTAQALAQVGAKTFIVGAKNHGSRRTRRRLARFRVGCEGRISHLKRGYGLGRSRLRGTAGARIHAGWVILAYDLDTVTRPRLDSG